MLFQTRIEILSQVYASIQCYLDKVDADWYLTQTTYVMSTRGQIKLVLAGLIRLTCTADDVRREIWVCHMDYFFTKLIEVAILAVVKIYRDWF